jgi:beta-glucanase (GH16 family)
VARLAALLLMTSAAFAHPEGWRLVWSDEFEGDRIDPARWEHEVNAWGGGNNELQYYTDRPENASVSNGLLRLTALREPFTGPEGTRGFTSARLRTKGRASWTYGRFEVRARLPRGQGVWPAVWMLPEDNAYGGWAASGEIDLMEALGQRPGEVFGTLHHGGSWPRNVYAGKTYTLPSGTIDDGFRTYALEWTEREFRWFVDGVCFQTQTEWRTEAAPYPAPFDKPFHLLLNVAVGGHLPGPPDDATPFPAVMEVDWVRVYERIPAPAP